jgi:hypothetical protein
MEDLIEQANEIQETMGRRYGVPDEVDEADLEAGSLDVVKSRITPSSSFHSCLQNSRLWVQICSRKRKCHLTSKTRLPFQTLWMKRLSMLNE